MRSLSAVQLGTGLVDPYAFDPNNPPVPDPSVVPFNALLLGNALTPILSVDSTPIYVADLPFMLTLTPAQAAPLAGGGLAGPFRVRAFNAETGALDELPTKLSLGDDGSVTLAISTPVVRPAAVPQPVVVDNSAPVVEDSVAANRDDAGSFSSDDAAAGSVDDWVAPAVDAAAAPPDDASALRVDDASQVTGDSADLTGLDEGAAPTP
jgi:hypothetical protein